MATFWETRYPARPLGGLVPVPAPALDPRGGRDLARRGGRAPPDDLAPAPAPPGHQLPSSPGRPLYHPPLKSPYSRTMWRKRSTTLTTAATTPSVERARPPRETPPSRGGARATAPARGREGERCWETPSTAGPARLLSSRGRGDQDRRRKIRRRRKKILSGLPAGDQVRDRRVRMRKVRTAGGGHRPGGQGQEIQRRRKRKMLPAREVVPAQGRLV